MKQIYKFASSIKMAVPVILTLAASLATATILESLYDTQTSQFYVYRAPWFSVLLGLLGVNIFLVAMSRWPWKKHHHPFLFAHLGILLLLAGSWITQRYGLDGMMRITEGDSESVVESEVNKLYFTRENKTVSYSVPKIPSIHRFKPIQISEFNLKIQDYIAHADFDFRFEADSTVATGATAALSINPAVKVTVKGGPMKIEQDFWLWAGDRNQAFVQAGPSILMLTTPDKNTSPFLKQQEGVWFELDYRPKYSKWILRSVQKKGGPVLEREVSDSKLKGTVYDPRWKGDISITIQEVISHAQRIIEWKPSHTQFGDQAPPPALLLESTQADGKASEVWLGLGERAALKTPEGEVAIAFIPKKETLPFSIRLDQFKIDRYSGTNNPSEYSSQVTIQDAKIPAAEKPAQQLISMNSPLTHQGITFYQSSYEEGQPRPTVSIFSVNQDPGRRTKYAGSIFLVMGIVLLFVQRLRLKKGSSSL